MRFTVERDSLLAAVRNAARVTDYAVEVTAIETRIAVSGQSTGDTSLQTTVDARTQETGRTCLPASTFEHAVKACDPGAISFEVNRESDHFAVIEDSSKSRFEIPVRVADLDLVFHQSASGPAVTVPYGGFVEGLKAAVGTASTDFSRPILCAVHIASSPEGLVFTATDSYRLARGRVAGLTLGDVESALIPARALSEIVRHEAEQIGVIVDGQRATFTVGGTEVSTRLVDGDFPKVDGLIPESSPYSFKVDAAAAADAVDKASAVVSDGTISMRFRQDEPVQVLGDDESGSRSAVDLHGEWDTDELTVVFNGKFLAESFKMFGDSKIKVGVIDALKPVTFQRYGDDSLFSLLMPTRRSK